LSGSFAGRVWLEASSGEFLYTVQRRSDAARERVRRELQMSDDQTAQGPPRPDPALKELDFLVGTWSMRGKLVGSDEENILGETTYEWLPGGFFLRQRVKMDFAGMVQIDSEELIGYDPATGKFPSAVYSNMSPEPLPYVWEVNDGAVTITVSHGPLDATFTGGLGDDGTFSGGWRPNPGADETVNPPYDIGGARVERVE
jgi:Protein of unknown function (DUF1579)